MIICWILTVTTGLDPQRDYVLEVAMARTDALTLEQTEEPIVLGIDIGDGTRAAKICGDDLFERYAENGLWDDLLGDGDPDYPIVPFADVPGLIIEYFGAGPCITGGFCLPFHTRFLLAQFRRLTESGFDFGPKYLDVQTLVGEAARAGRKIRKPPTYRALPDLLGYIEILRELRCD